MTEEAAAPTTEPNEITERAAPVRSFSLLAKEMFGDEFKGEVKTETEPKEQVEEAKSSDAEQEEAPADGDGETESATETDEAPISSVSELIEHLETDPEWFNGLKVQVKVNDKPVETTLSDLIKNYQIEEAAKDRLEQAKAKAQAVNQELAEKSQALEGQFAVVAKMVEGAEALLNQDVRAVDWAKLREDDPAEYAARHAEIRERRDRIELMKRDAVTSWQEAGAKTQAERLVQLRQHLQSEQSALLENLPEWRDDAKAKAEKAQLADYLLKRGFTQQDVMGASDHRLVLLARKAMLFDQGQAKVDVAKKKLAKVPKVMKPGAAKPQEQISRERLEHSHSKLRKTGSFDDALAYLKAKRGGK